jgi:head-tail adaptor
MTMVIGNMRYKILVKRLTTTRDSNNGSVVETWATVYTLKASIPRGSGTKTIRNEEIFNTSTVTFNTYYRDIEETDRIYYEGDYYKIMMIGEIGFKEGLEIIAEKITE